ncbi:anti-sigma F factor antagonist [Kribbella koreensis]|uniref:Anti-sigma factor antagonist n=1 Tax=Kribbella koreensis TaxID=57909 RepID=A0ABN1PIC1_9ACTN
MSNDENPLIIRIDATNDLVVVELAGDLDMETTPALTAELKAVLGARPVVVELSGVEFMDSSGIGVLLGAHREAAAEGGALLLVAASPRLQKIFKITHLHKVFALHETMESAVASLESPLEIEGAPVETVVPGFTTEPD